MRISIKKAMPLLLFFFLCTSTPLFGHETHRMKAESANSVEQINQRPTSWIQWFGGFHLILLHFPIGLLFTSFFFELLFLWYKNPVLAISQKVTLITGALFAIPTAIFGIILKFSSEYFGADADIMIWHMVSGILTTLFALTLVYIQQQSGKTYLYYGMYGVLCLFLLVTGYLGGITTFGREILYFPHH